MSKSHTHKKNGFTTIPSHKMHQLAFLGLFTDRNRADFPALSYTSLSPPTSVNLPFYIPEYNIPTSSGASPYRPLQRIPPGGNHLFVSLTLQKTSNIVSAEVATVLRFSRFASHLEFQPLESGTSAPTDDVYRNADPFAYCAVNNVAKGSGSCKPKAV